MTCDAFLSAVAYRDLLVSIAMKTQIFAVDTATTDFDGFNVKSWGILRDAGKGRGAE